MAGRRAVVAADNLFAPGTRGRIDRRGNATADTDTCGLAQVDTNVGQRRRAAIGRGVRAALDAGVGGIVRRQNYGCRGEKNE